MDKRVISCNNLPSTILGMDRFDQKVTQNNDEDYVDTEIRRFMELLRKSNTSSIEVLFAKESSFMILSPEIKYLRENKSKLINSENFFNSVTGYINSQKKLAFSATDKCPPESKRGERLKKYGYDYKGVSTIFRLIGSVTSFLLLVFIE